MVGLELLRIPVDNIEETKMNDLEIEAFAIQNPGRKPKAKIYIIRIDKTLHRVSEPEMSGREMLALAGKSPVEKYRLKQKLRAFVPRLPRPFAPGSSRPAFAAS
jgi:hypothetical protein